MSLREENAMSSKTNSPQTSIEEPGEPEYPPRFSGRGRRGRAVLCAALAYPVYRYLASPAEMAIERHRRHRGHAQGCAEAAAGSVLMFKFGTSPAMLIHHLDGRWISMTAVCTHLGCTVQYEPQADRIHCACHGGVYNPYTGANVSGPPPKPLKLFKVAVNETGVEVSRA